MNFYLQPVWVKKADDSFECQLYNIWGDKACKTDWYGSRRTVSQCKVYMAPKKEELVDERPFYDTHIKMQRTFLTFGEKWWCAIFKEIERREKAESLKA